MKIGAILRSYKLTSYLRYVLKNLSDIDLVIVPTGPYANVLPSEDNTVEIIRDLKQPNVLVKPHKGFEQKDLFNECMSYMKDMDFVLVNDADEILLKKDREEIIRRMVDKKANAGMCSVIDYQSDSSAFPIRTHKPVVVIKPEVRFDGNRSVAYGDGVMADDIYLHHFGYCMNPEEMLWKLKNIWYEKDSFLEIVSQSPTEIPKPKELLEVFSN